MTTLNPGVHERGEYGKYKESIVGRKGGGLMIESDAYLDAVRFQVPLYSSTHRVPPSSEQDLTIRRKDASLAANNLHETYQYTDTCVNSDWICYEYMTSTTKDTPQQNMLCITLARL